MKHNKNTYIAALGLLALLMAGCGKSARVEMSLDKSARNDPFFETTRFIMTKEERSIYRHLVDVDARKQFQREFWEKRDPTPETEVNENKIQYQKRIEFANKWFRDRPDGRGFDTERGHLLLQLGFPDHRDHRVTTPSGSTMTVKIDYWYYYQYDLVLRFIDWRANGQFKLRGWPDNLLYALDRALASMDLGKDALNKTFNFKVKFDPSANSFEIRLPVKQLDFEDSGDSVKTSFHVRLYVYHNLKKIKAIEKDHLFSSSKDNLIKQKYISLTIPYTPVEKGKYLVEIVIRDPVSQYSYRNFTKFKI